MLKSLYLNELEAYINRLHNFVEWPPIAVVHHHVACTHADHKRLHRQLHRFITLTQDTDLFLGIICILCTDTQVIKGKRVNEVDLYSTFTVVHTQGAQVRITQCYPQITFQVSALCCGNQAPHQVL